MTQPNTATDKPIVMVVVNSSHKGQSSQLFAILTRRRSLTIIVAAGLCSILYLIYLLPHLAVRRSFIQSAPQITLNTTQHKLSADSHPRRLIVFGDSWSDNRQYPIDPPPSQELPSWKEAQGKVWTEWLCSAVEFPHD